MKESHKKFIKVFAAVLPVLSPLCAPLQTAVLVSAGALLVTHLFMILKPLFPAGLFRTAVVLFLAVSFQIIQGIFHPAPFWIVSLGLLLDWNDYDPKHLGQRPLAPLVRCSIFCGAVLFAGLVREIFGKKFGVEVFLQPAGIFAALAFFAVLILALEKPLAPLWLKKRGAK